MSDQKRTDIAQVIFDWYKKHKNRKDLESCTITVDQFLGLEPLDPPELIENSVCIKLTPKDGSPITILEKFPGKLQIKGCDTCKYEIYYTVEENEGWYSHKGIYHFRDCVNMDTGASEYFTIKCGNKTSKEEIPGLFNCPFWKEGIKIQLEDEPVTEVIKTSKRSRRKGLKYRKHTREAHG